jgi:hypothetical protein
MSAKHMAPESIAHITIQLWPRASIMQRLVLLPIFSRDLANQQLRQCPQLLLPHLFPPWGIKNITNQSLPADGGQEVVFNHQEDENDHDEQLPPLQRIWDCPYRLGVARPFLMLKALFLILPLILPFKH